MRDESAAHQQLVIARVIRRLIPFAFICYVVAYLDRVNVGFAAEGLQRDLSLTNTEFGIGLGTLLPGLLPLRGPQ